MVGELDLSVLFYFVCLIIFVDERCSRNEEKSKRKLSKYVCIVLSEERPAWGEARRNGFNYSKLGCKGEERMCVRKLTGNGTQNCLMCLVLELCLCAVQ